MKNETEKPKNKVGRPRKHLTDETCYAVLKLREEMTIAELAKLYNLKPRTMSQYIRIAKDRELAGKLAYLDEPGDYTEFYDRDERG